MAQRPGTLDLIEQITRLDGTKYFEIGNMAHNGRAELAAERGYIKEVRILKLNIPHSQTVIKYETTSTNTFIHKKKRWITGRNGKRPQPKRSWWKPFCAKITSDRRSTCKRSGRKGPTRGVATLREWTGCGRSRWWGSSFTTSSSRSYQGLFGGAPLPVDFGLLCH